MSTADALLDVLVREDGEALVLHVGERPAVVRGTRSIEAASAAMTLASMDALLGELLPTHAHRILDELGAVEADLAPLPAGPADRLTVVAARGGDDIWIEVRRRRPGGPAAGPESNAWGVGGPPVKRTPPPDATPAPAHASVPLPAPVPAPAVEPAPAVVLPLNRQPIRADVPARLPARPAGLDRLLRLAAARGAEALYLLSHARPSIRIEGELLPLEGEPALAPSEVEGLLLEVLPDRGVVEDLQGTGAEWMCDVPDVGRVRCLTFRDHRGPGGLFRMIPARALSAEQLGLSREIQSLCAEPEGLVLVTGPRASGKSTLIAAFVDLILRTRADHVVTIESRIKVVHESRASLVSQREVRSGEGAAATLRAALRENPDVIVIEDLRSSDVIALALEAAASGHLVIGGLTAHDAAEAVGRLLDQVPADRRPSAQALLAETLRGVVAQVLLRKSGGGRVAARELLLNSPQVATLVAEGRIPQLPLALDGGRRQGMVPLSDALAAFVQSGVVDAREAWRKASDRPGLLKLLKRDGIDTSFVERKA